MTVKKLPTVKYKGLNYTIDERLQEYRCMDYEFIVIHIPFDSDEGLKISERKV